MTEMRTIEQSQREAKAAHEEAVLTRSTLVEKAVEARDLAGFTVVKATMVGTVARSAQLGLTGSNCLYEMAFQKPARLTLDPPCIFAILWSYLRLLAAPAMTVTLGNLSGLHAQSSRNSEGSTSSAAAKLRIVRIWGSVIALRSNRPIWSRCVSALSASSSRLSNRFWRSFFSFSPLILTMLIVGNFVPP